jgi:hypothetical protein
MMHSCRYHLYSDSTCRIDTIRADVLNALTYLATHTTTQRYIKSMHSLFHALSHPIIGLYPNGNIPLPPPPNGRRGCEGGKNGAGNPRRGSRKSGGSQLCRGGR